MSWLCSKTFRLRSLNACETDTNTSIIRLSELPITTPAFCRCLPSAAGPYCRLRTIRLSTRYRFDQIPESGGRQSGSACRAWRTDCLFVYNVGWVPAIRPSRRHVRLRNVSGRRRAGACAVRQQSVSVQLRHRHVTFIVITAYRLLRLPVRSVDHHGINARRGWHAKSKTEKQISAEFVVNGV